MKVTLCIKVTYLLFLSPVEIPLALVRKTSKQQAQKRERSRLTCQEIELAKDKKNSDMHHY